MSFGLRRVFLTSCFGFPFLSGDLVCLFGELLEIRFWSDRSEGRERVRAQGSVYEGKVMRTKINHSRWVSEGVRMKNDLKSKLNRKIIRFARVSVLKERGAANV